jgi:hypothetical protein
MKNYNFESRPMSLEEKELLEAQPKMYLRTAIFIFIVLSTIIFIWLTKAEFEDPVDWLSRISKKELFSLLGSIIPSGIVIFMSYKFGINQIQQDLNIGVTSLAKAVLQDFMEGDDDSNLGFHYLYEGSTEYINFYFQGTSIIKLKSFVNPVRFADVDKYVLRKSLKKGTFYTLAFSLNSDFLFSIEEI